MRHLVLDVFVGRAGIDDGVRPVIQEPPLPREGMPQLLGDEGDEGMTERQDRFVDPDQDGLLHLPFHLARPGGEHGLDHFEVPVAEFVPDELVEGGARLVEPVFLDPPADLVDHALEPGEDPPVRHRQVVRKLPQRRVVDIHPDESARLVQLVHEVAVPPSTGRGHGYPALGGSDEGEAESGGAEPVDTSRGSMTFPRVLLIFSPLASDEGVITTSRRGLSGELDPNISPRDPEERCRIPYQHGRGVSTVQDQTGSGHQSVENGRAPRRNRYRERPLSCRDRPPHASTARGVVSTIVFPTRGV